VAAIRHIAAVRDAKAKGGNCRTAVVGSISCTCRFAGLVCKRPNPAGSTCEEMRLYQTHDSHQWSWQFHDARSCVPSPFRRWQADNVEAGAIIWVLSNLMREVDLA